MFRPYIKGIPEIFLFLPSKILEFFFFKSVDSVGIRKPKASGLKYSYMVEKVPFVLRRMLQVLISPLFPFGFLFQRIWVVH